GSRGYSVFNSLARITFYTHDPSPLKNSSPRPWGRRWGRMASMIKSLLILALLIVVTAGAFLSRPNEESFTQYFMAEHQSSGSQLEQFFGTVKLHQYLGDLTYRDRFLWTQMDRDGEMEYLGLFSRWFHMGDGEVKMSGPPLDVPLPFAVEAQEVPGDVRENLPGDAAPRPKPIVPER